MEELSTMEKVSFKGSNRLSFKKKVGFGIGDMANNFIIAGVSNYLLFFYTDVFGITAGAAGILLLIGRIFDAINDPFMGAIVDRTKSRWGKCRPYILFGALPAAIITVLLFTTPPFDITGKIIWAYVTYVLWDICFTVIAVPYNALAASLTTDYQERSNLSAYKMIFAAMGVLLVTVLAKPMTETLGSSIQAGYTITFSIFGAAAVVLFILCFAFTKEKNYESKDRESNSLKELIKPVIHNRPLIVLMILFILYQVAYSLFRSVELYFFKYVLQRDNLFSIAVLVGNLCALVGIAIMPMIVSKLDKKRTVFLGGISGSAVFLIMYVIPGNLSVSLAGIGLSYFFLGIPYALLFGIVPDTVEYGQWKTGIRAPGFIFSAFSFSQKAGMAFAAALAGWILTEIGYKPNVAQTPAAVNGILMMRTIIPGGLIILGLLIFIFYNLSREQHKKIVEELKLEAEE